MCEESEQTFTGSCSEFQQLSTCFIFCRWRFRARDHLTHLEILAEVVDSDVTFVVGVHRLEPAIDVLSG